ncbi:MAG: response regulator [Magnetococcales bacterium]|nr:response regulator [Magnetococcales bacterium]
MKDNHLNGNGPDKPQKRVALLFLMLALFLLMLTGYYWLQVLEPKLDADAKSNATALASSNAMDIEHALEPINGKVSYNTLSQTLDSILIIKEPNTNSPFVMGILIELDYNVVAAKKDSLNLEKGVIECADCFKISIPLYDKKTQELIGIANFWSSGAFIKSLKADVRIKLLIGIVLFLLIMAFVWHSVSGLLLKLHAGEQQLRNLFENLTQNKELLRATIESSPDGILVVNNFGEVTHYNGNFINMWQIPKNLMDKRDDVLLLNFVTSQLSEPEAFLNKVKELYRTDHISLDIIPFKDGKRFERSSMPLIISGENMGRVWSFKDITSRVIAERSIKQNLLDRKLMNKKLQEALESANTANRAKSQFLATMSHEIRTPMNAVQGSVELLRRKNMPNDQLKLVDIISHSTKNLLQILDDVLDISKIEAGKFDIDFIEFSLSTLMEKLSATMSPNAMKKGLEIQCLIQDDVPNLLYGDPSRVQQVLWNLVSNSIKFSQDGVIIIEVRKVSNERGVLKLAFLVKDSGIGIPPEQLEEIFDPFVQVDSTISRSQHGTGLGLAICKQLVDLMNGEIGVESRPGHGSTFSFVLPFKEEGVEIRIKEQKKLNKPASLSLLLVEDEPVSQLVVANLLKDEGYEVVVAASGTEALEKIDLQLFDIILMDLRMPGMDGIQTTKRIRELTDKKKAGVKIVAFTGDVMIDTVQQCIEIGMDGVIAKPININEINRAMASFFAE